MPKDRNSRRNVTLFSPDAYPHRGTLPGDYFYWIRGRAEVGEGNEKEEAQILSHALEHEAGIDFPRGLIAGPLILRMDGRRVDCEGTAKGVTIPRWVESDGCEFVECSARAILFVESEPVFRALKDVPQFRKTPIVMVCSCGIPRLPFRRIVHRMRYELDIPVLALTDLRPWGFFVLSTLVRGCIAPHLEIKQLAVHDIRYLGLSPEDWLRWKGESRIADLTWKASWTSRMKALRELRPFRGSRTWGQRFAMFERVRRGLRVDDAMTAVGEENFFVHYIAQRIPL